jgi:putative nucleotidyltransferase with HDIG domain
MQHENNFTDNTYLMLQQLDSQTLSHCTRANNIAERIEHSFNMNTHLLADAALVHDIGKIYISSLILNKVGKLTTLERQIINLHSYYSYKILKDMDVSETICNIVLYHHGINPLTLEDVPRCEDKEILAYAKMLHTIDVYEALTSSRVYRNSFTQDEALTIMKNEKGYDKNVLEFLKDIKI